MTHISSCQSRNIARKHGRKDISGWSQIPRPEKERRRSLAALDRHSQSAAPREHRKRNESPKLALREAEIQPPSSNFIPGPEIASYFPNPEPHGRSSRPSVPQDRSQVTGRNTRMRRPRRRGERGWRRATFRERSKETTPGKERRGGGVHLEKRRTRARCSLRMLLRSAGCTPCGAHKAMWVGRVGVPPAFLRACLPRLLSSLASLRLFLASLSQPHAS